MACGSYIAQYLSFTTSISFSLFRNVWMYGIAVLQCQFKLFKCFFSSKSLIIRVSWASERNGVNHLGGLYIDFFKSVKNQQWICPVMDNKHRKTLWNKIVLWEDFNGTPIFSLAPSFWLFLSSMTVCVCACVCVFVVSMYRDSINDL